MSSLSNLVGFVGYVWQHGDQLLALLRQLPPVLHSAGAELVRAGDGAALVGRAFGGASAERPNAAEVLEGVTQAVEECAQQIQAVSRDLRAVAAALDRIKIPTVTPVKQHFNFRLVGLGEHDLVTGITLGDQGPGLLGDVTESLRAQADALESGFGGRLRTVAENLGHVSRGLDGAGDRLTSLGDSLKKGGTALGQFGP